MRKESCLNTTLLCWAAPTGETQRGSVCVCASVRESVCVCVYVLVHAYVRLELLQYVMCVKRD